MPDMGHPKSNAVLSQKLKIVKYLRRRIQVEAVNEILHRPTTRAASIVDNRRAAHKTNIAVVLYRVKSSGHSVLANRSRTARAGVEDLPGVALVRGRGGPAGADRAEGVVAEHELRAHQSTRGRVKVAHVGALLPEYLLDKHLAIHIQIRRYTSQDSVQSPNR